jgi:glycosyltransferase involved in cell wall biosynthesis
VIRVLHVLEAVEGGTARHVVDLVESVPEVEHIVAMPEERHVGVTARDAAGAIISAGGEVVVVDMHRQPWSLRNVTATGRVRSLVRQRRVDVVHAHSTIGGVVGRLAAIRTGVPVAYTPNGLARGALATAVERALGRVTDVLVAVSPSERSDVLARRLVPAEGVVVIPNGVVLPGPPVADLRAVADVPAGAPILGFVGRFAWQKAPEVFLDMAERVGSTHPDLHVVVIGDGPDRSVVEARLVDGPLGPRLHWLPYLQDASHHLGELTILASPSRFEGAPYVPLEAMRAGVPVVLTDCTGSRDLIEDGRNGRIVPIDDVDALTAAVEELLRDPVRRSAIAAAGAQTVSERYSLERVGTLVGALYRDLAARQA